MGKQPENIVLFDGICNLCNATVIFIIKRDTQARFTFTPLQSAKGKELLDKYSLPTNDLDSFVYIRDGKSYIKSTAGIKVLRELGWPYSLFFGFMVIPRFLRDLIYDLVAKTRYNIFGKRNSCMVPDARYKNRFLR